MSLTALSILAAHLSEENVDELLREAEGKTTRQVKEIVAGIAPKPVVGPGIRRKPVRSLEAAAESPVECAAMVPPAPPPPEEERRCRRGRQRSQWQYPEASSLLPRA